MFKHIAVFILATFACVLGVSAQISVQAQQEASFKKVDFLNYTYSSGICASEFGMAKSIKVQNGSFKNDEFYFYIPDSKIVYGDVTGDKRTDAVVSIACGGNAGNFSLATIQIFMQSGGKEKLLATIDTHKLEADYKRYFPKGFIVGITKDGVKLRGTHIVIEAYTDGSNASPKNIATFEYHMNFTKPVLGSKPRLRPSGI